MKYVLLGWLTFVALVYLLMWIDYFTHKHNIAEGIRDFVETFSREE